MALSSAYAPCDRPAANTTASSKRFMLMNNLVNVAVRLPPFSSIPKQH
jgi:hypothetical protein